MVTLNTNPFQPAKKEQANLRLAIMGPSGSGKTWTALLIAERLAELRGGKIAFLDTEGRSARKYADRFTFDVYDLSKNYDPQRYITGIHAAAQFGYAVIVVDSLTHAWNGVGGVLDIVDNAGKKMGGNDWAGWSKGRPAQNNFVDALINAEIDVIGTMRTKTDWVLEVDARGKTKPVKKGLAPVQSSDFEYEFDVVMNLDMSHTMSISKSRCHDIACEMEYRDTEYVATTLHNWLSDGEPVEPKSSQDEESGDGTGEKETRGDKQINWYDNIENIRNLVSRAVEVGYIEKPDTVGNGSKELLSLVDQKSWSAYSSLKEAGEAIKTEGEKLKAELASRNDEKVEQSDESSDDDTPEEVIEEEATETVSSTEETASDGDFKTLSAKDKKELDEWIVANFYDKTFASVCQEMNTDFAGYSSIGEAKNKILKVAMEGQWAILTDMVFHKKQGKSSYLLFNSTLPNSDIRHYSRTKFVEMLGDEFKEADKIKDLAEGDSVTLDENIVIWWEPASKASYQTVVRAHTLDGIPF